jgi:hypothetical protein
VFAARYELNSYIVFRKRLVSKRLTEHLLVFLGHKLLCDHFCGLVVRVLGYRSGGPGSIPGTTRKKVVGLERGPLSFVSTNEELLDRKVAAPVYKTENMAVGFRHDEHVATFIRKSWQSLRRQAAVARSV